MSSVTERFTGCEHPRSSKEKVYRYGWHLVRIIRNGIGPVRAKEKTLPSKVELSRCSKNLGNQFLERLQPDLCVMIMGSWLYLGKHGIHDVNRMNSKRRCSSN